MANREHTPADHRTTQAERRERVAIIGGGCAGLTAAFELSRPEHRGRYEITVYQMGWRLGGKGASGRARAGRIEEHGLHLWMGFYENAFRLMRECYAELGRDPQQCPIARWDDAFKPAPFVAVTDRTQRGEWEFWMARFPATHDQPGDPLDEHNPYTLNAYLAKAAALVIELLRSATAPPSQRSEERSAWSQAAERVNSPERLVESVEWLLRHGQLAGAAALLEALQLLRTLLDASAQLVNVSQGNVVLRLVEAIAGAARRQLELLVEHDAPLRRSWQLVDLVLAIIRGSISHGLSLNPQGFDAIDDYDWREWLALHGASDAALQSGFVRAIYDLAFAYVDGDPARPQLSAACALRGALRMFFTYRGALFWRMSAGMGDCVFAPLYEVLERRGVRFEFFHRLAEIACEGPAGSAHVSALHFDVQAEPRSGAYEPLVDVNGLPCWPAAPDYAQLLDGTQLEHERIAFESPWERRRTRPHVLRVGEDFDFTVLAVGGGAVAGVSAQLIARSPRWQRMSEHLHSVATQALQLWLRESLPGLGWRQPPVNLSGWVEPFDTWADMTHLIPAEASRASVKSIAYFCSPLPGAARQGEEFVAEQRERVREAARGFMQRELVGLWPRARAEAGGFRWELLALEPDSDAALSGEARFDQMFWTANVRPSDRYVLSLPGAQKHRLSPLDMSFDNLTVAGDWTHTGLNTGCVESAVISGLLAAHALSGRPALEGIIGYDHP